MAAMIRVGAGALVDRRFQSDVLEEIRIMAEAAGFAGRDHGKAGYARLHRWRVC